MTGGGVWIGSHHSRLGEEAAIDSLTHLPAKSRSISESSKAVCRRGKIGCFGVRPGGGRTGTGPKPRGAGQEVGPLSGQRRRQARRSTEFRQPGLRGGMDGPACLRAILAEKIRLSHRNNLNRCVKLYPGMVTIEPKEKPRVGAGLVYLKNKDGFLIENEDGSLASAGVISACMVLGRSSATNKREKIKQFSTKSRRRLIKTLCRFPHSWRFRFELTFPDDVMDGKTIEERARLACTVLHRTQDLIKAKFPGLQMVWKREWELRKTGRLKGELCPHYHCMAYGPNYEDKQYTEMYIYVALKWVKYSGTQEVQKAMSVIMHRGSYGYLKENDPFTSYFAKYVSKRSTIEGEGIGRFWGVIGPVEQAEGEEQRLTDRKTIQLTRFLRRYLHSTQKRRKKIADGSVMVVRPKRRYEKALRNSRFSGFVAIRKATVQRFLDSD